MFLIFPFSEINTTLIVLLSEVLFFLHAQTFFFLFSCSDMIELLHSHKNFFFFLGVGNSQSLIYFTWIQKGLGQIGKIFYILTICTSSNYFVFAL